jgi:cytochrome c
MPLLIKNPTSSHMLRARAALPFASMHCSSSAHLPRRHQACAASTELAGGRWRLLSAAAIAALACIPAAAQEKLIGERLFSVQCASCHSPATSETHRFGPNLGGIVGRPAGSVPGMRFSPAFQKALRGRTWDEALLDSWLANPQSVARGTTMLYSQPDADKRRAIIDYLKTLK